MPTPFTLSGAPNFRDMGGYATASGQTVRSQRIFRSDHLANLGEADLSTLTAALGEAVRVIDLRGVAERQSAMCCIPNATVHSLPIEPTVLQRLNELQTATKDLAPADMVVLMQDTYRNFVRANTPVYATLFRHLLDEADTAPLVFHCTAGKDRTGFAAALLLHALGVPHEVVMQDYLLTNVRLAGTAPALAMSPEVIAVLWGVQAEFLHAAFEAVDADYGSLDAYLRDGLQLGPAEHARLRALYLV